jgi:hypothetical protein
MPRELPQSSLHLDPHFGSISKPISELNWRYVSVQAGLGKNVQVGQEAGKSVQVCIAVKENPLRNHVTRLREQEAGAVKESNVLPMTLSPRVPAPAVGGVAEGRLMGKGAKRSIKGSLEDDKENNVVNSAGTLKRKATIAKKSSTRATAQQAFVEVPGDVANDEPMAKVVPRRMAPPERKASGSMVPTQAMTTRATTSKPATIAAPPTLSKRFTSQREAEVNIDADAISTGPKKTLRGIKDAEGLVRPPTRAEINVPSRVPPRIQAQHATLQRTKTQDNLRQVSRYIAMLIISGSPSYSTGRSDSASSSFTFSTDYVNHLKHKIRLQDPSQSCRSPEYNASRNTSDYGRQPHSCSQHIVKTPLEPIPYIFFKSD